MKKNNSKLRKNPQGIQDDIFRKMSADRKIEVGSQLWQLAKALVGDKINYARERSKTSSSRCR